jgi:prophage regulatory protein
MGEPIKYLPLPEVMKLVGLSKATIYRNVAAHTFPAPYELSTYRVGWKESEIQAWLSSRTRRKVGRSVVRLRQEDGTKLGLAKAS